MNEQIPTEEPINDINRLVTTRMDETIKQLNVLSAITRTAMSSCDMTITVMVLLEQLCEQFCADAAAFWVYQHASNSLELLSWRGTGPKPKPAPISDLCSGYPGKVLKTTEPGNLSPDLDTSAFCRPEMIAGRSFHAYLAIPLIIDAKIIGVVEIYHQDPQAQDANSRSNLIHICQQCALPLNLIHTVTEANRNNQFLLSALEDTLSSYANTLDMHEHKKTGHSTGLAHTASHLARALGLPEEKVAIIKRGALLHDLGNIIISDEIFLKPGPLTDEEWVIIQQHTRTGYDFLKDVAFLKPSLEILYSHHERWDGKGYPEALHGDQIPFYARIFSVADTWECLLSDRPYRSAFSRDETLDFIRQQSGLAFDPAIVEIFLENPPTGGRHPTTASAILTHCR